MALPVARRRSCRGSAGRRSRHRGCAAAPRRGTSAPRPRGDDSAYSCRKASMPALPEPRLGAPPRRGRAPGRRSGRASRPAARPRRGCARPPRSRLRDKPRAAAGGAHRRAAGLRRRSSAAGSWRVLRRGGRNRRRHSTVRTGACPQGGEPLDMRIIYIPLLFVSSGLHQHVIEILRPRLIGLVREVRDRRARHDRRGEWALILGKTLAMLARSRAAELA